MTTKQDLKWGDIVSPTPLGRQRLKLTKEDYGIFLKNSRTDENCFIIVMWKKGYATSYSKDFWYKK